MPVPQALSVTPGQTLAGQRAAGVSRRSALQLGTALGAGGLVAGWPRIARSAAAVDARPALPVELLDGLPAAQPLGSARLRFLGLDIYEARLWVQAGFNPADYGQSPFAMELHYFRALSGRLIAERSLKEMRRQGNPGAVREQAWLDAMVQAFPDVQAGDRITGLHTPAQGARFWLNGQTRPGVRDAEFSRLFFGIWLSDASSEPQMRASLLGRSS